MKGGGYVSHSVSGTASPNRCHLSRAQNIGYEQVWWWSREERAGEGMVSAKTPGPAMAAQWDWEPASWRDGRGSVGTGAGAMSPTHLGQDARLYSRCDGKVEKGRTDICKRLRWHVGAAQNTGGQEEEQGDSQWGPGAVVQSFTDERQGDTNAPNGQITHIFWKMASWIECLRESGTRDDSKVSSWKNGEMVMKLCLL